MKSRKFYIIVAVFLIILLGVFFIGIHKWRNGGYSSMVWTKLSRNQSSSGHDRSPGERAMIEKFTAAFNSPIEIYGRVIDQHGDPVPGATVDLIPNDTPWSESKSKRKIICDAEGSFSATGLRGIALGVRASKEGYLEYSTSMELSSAATIDYGGDAKAGKRFSNPATPLVLKLHKIGLVEPMVYVEKKNWSLPVDGTTRGIALDSKSGKGPHQIEFRLKTDWVNLPKDNDINKKQYDWSFEARIPGGGFVQNYSDYNFEAPETGYQETIRMEFTADMPREQWRAFKNARYFVKFADGSYGRIRLSIEGFTDWSPLTLTSWLNLKPGSRNLASAKKDNYFMRD